MDAFTQEMEQKLLAAREELLRKLNSEGDDFRNEAQASSGRGDSSDLASDEGAYRKMEALNAMDAKKLKAIENALKRISDGRYGSNGADNSQNPENIGFLLVFFFFSVQKVI